MLIVFSHLFSNDSTCQIVAETLLLSVDKLGRTDMMYKDQIITPGGCSLRDVQVNFPKSWLKYDNQSLKFAGKRLGKGRAILS